MDLIYSFTLLVALHVNRALTSENVTDGNVTSVERSVSVSFDNTKIYFFGDKIEFAGEVHNRYPAEVPAGTYSANGSSSSSAEADAHILRQWGTPAPPGANPAPLMPRVHYINAECQNDFMKISILFNGSFTGMIYSAKYAYNPDCLYVNGTGAQRYEFYIRLNRCGTLNGAKGREGSHDNKKMMWNTVTVQYNPLIEEEWDEHFRVTCEYGYQFWKKVSFPVLDVRVPTENPLLFTLSPPECQMEIRSGFNLEGERIERPVNVGDPLTLLIYMRSPTVGFDIIINNCLAHNGASKQMPLIDDSGCPVQSKIISDFKGIDLHHGIYESKVYAYFKAFRFTGSPALYIECDVRMCHGICPKQKCYWRNLRGRDEPSAPLKELPEEPLTAANRSDARASLNVSEVSTSTSTSAPSTTTLKTTAAATSATTSRPPLVTAPTRNRKQNRSSSTTTTTARPKPTSPATTVRKSDRTSTIKLNLNTRVRAKRGDRKRKEEEEEDAPMSDTLNLFQALEVRSEPIQSDMRVDNAVRAGEDKVVCVNRLGFTALLCILLLVVILTTSVTCMLCARLRHLKSTCGGRHVPPPDRKHAAAFSGNYVISTRNT